MNYDEAIRQIQEQQERRAADLPTVEDCLSAAANAYQRLKDLGWEEFIYCPNDGTYFDVIEFGSTSVHSCVYMGDWPRGSWFIEEAGDLWPARPALFKLKLPKE